MMEQENGGRVTDVDLTATVARLDREIGALREELARLDADLDESRRLNLRAAELLDIVYERLSAASG